MKGDVDTSVAALQPWGHSGWLEKQGRQLRAWRRRFCVLRDRRLWYFHGETAAHAAGCVALDGTVVARSEGDTRKRAHVFSVRTRARTFFFAAPSTEARADWLQAINNAISQPPFSPDEGDGEGDDDDKDNKDKKKTAQDASREQEEGGEGERKGEGEGTPSEEDSEGMKRMRAVRDVVGFLDGTTGAGAFWRAWVAAMPRAAALGAGQGLAHCVATSLDRRWAGWRVAGPQALFAARAVAFFWRMGAPAAEVARLNDVGALTNPRTIGAWVDTSAAGGTDGGWVFPVETPLRLALEAADHPAADGTDPEETAEGAAAGAATAVVDAPKVFAAWAEAHSVLTCTEVARDMGPTPPRQTEFRVRLPGADFGAQIGAARAALADFGFPAMPEGPVAVLARACTGVDFGAEPLQLSVVTCAEGFVRCGVLVPCVPAEGVAALHAAAGAAPEGAEALRAATGCEAPAFVELRCLLPGYGYGVYREGYDIVLHWDLGTDIRE